MKNFSTVNIEPKLRVRDARPHFNAFTITLLVLLILYTVSLFTPLVWGLLRSFQKQSEFRLNIIGLPKKWVWNYSYVFKMFFVRVPSTAGVKKVGMGMMFLYAFLYSLGCAFTSTLIPCVTAYLCARYKFRFSKVIYTTVIVTMVLPIVGALGAQAVFHREGRLPQRPLAPLDSVLKEHGMTLREDGDLLYCSGQLIGGNYTIAGNVSSQYISGLLMALPLLIRDSLLMVSGPLESAAYVAMTEDALQLSKLTIPKMGAMWAIPGQQRCHLPKRTVVEGDWSNTAFFLCMGALSKEGVTVEGLNLQSSQGDRGVLDVLRRFGAEVTEHGDAVTVRRGALHGVMIDAAPIPDLIPVLSVVASVAEGETRVENAYRLRLKESDRLKSTADLLRALGGQVEEKEDGLVITGVPALHGGAVETQNDHRLAMSAATAACAATGEITVDNDGCVAKSYPRFWEDFSSLKGEGL